MIIKKCTDSFSFGPAVEEASSIRDRRNWLIHQLYIRQDYNACLNVVESELQESDGTCEYALYVKGILKRIEGELFESLTLLQAAVLLVPRSLASRKQLGRAFFLCGLYEEAEVIFEEAEVLVMTQGDADDWEIQYDIGRCNMCLHRYERACEAFRRSVSIESHEKNILQLGQAFIYLRDYQSAIQIYQDALKAFSTSVTLFELLGELHLNEGRVQEAFHYFNSCLSLDPHSVRSLLVVSSVIQQNGQYDVALAKYSVALECIPESANVWNNVAACLFGQKKYDAAIACLRKSLIADPFEWITHHNLSVIYLNMARYVSAFHHISACIASNPKYAHAYMILGICLCSVNELENAYQAYEKAIFLNDDLMCRINYAVTLVNNSMMKQASEQYQAALAIWDRWSYTQRAKSGVLILNMLIELRKRLMGEEAPVTENRAPFRPESSPVCETPLLESRANP